MPVTSKVGCLPRDNHHVTGLRRDLLLAAGAQIRLARLERLDAPDLDVAEVGIDQRGISAHSSSPATTANESATIR